MIVSLRPGMQVERDKMLKKLVNMQYSRNEIDFKRGTFRAKGDIVEIYPSDKGESAIRVEFWGDEIEKISEIVKTFENIQGKIFSDICVKIHELRQRFHLIKTQGVVAYVE